ncbi:HAD family hydrolase [Paenibacillus hexagrammi]|uniref:Cof-type HAD-IIB family hydrolase n=1 Tax=Paenibacillus hexagrammi TaxID=2908839 RepID=A0ABY3SDZ0_9BACL|nr:HAD family hydrolase [Paenibacillus sp. YPD9-1]UJF32141.1 Cof-type HAD-IIB family hydrolase [Paenibacillus sp. YPD9-1]
MIKMIVSDLDGTLLDHSKKVSRREIDALKRIQAAGIELCLASGRMHVEMQQVMQEIDFEAHSVSQNGAFVHVKDGTRLFTHFFSPELAYEVYQVVKEFDMVKLICTGDANYTVTMDSATAEIQARMFQPFIVKEDVGAALQSDMRSCKFSFFGKVEVLMQVKEALQQKFGEQLDIYMADHDCLDVMPQNVSKGSSLLVLLEHLGLRPEEVACVGDSFNDVSMFGITPNSYAMKTAHRDVQLASAYQVHSVAEAIEHAFAASKFFESRGTQTS